MIVNEPVQDTFEDTPAKDRDPDWFKRAVFYEVLVRSFQDSNGDGIGDLKGITSRLPYVAELGVDAVWLAPFFTSPQKDFGYDISDYCGIDPAYGSLADFDALVAEIKAAYAFLEPAFIRRLARLYGTRAKTLLGLSRSLGDLGRHFGADLYEAEIRYLIEHEWARTADDVLWRRTKRGLKLSAQEAAELADFIARESAPAGRALQSEEARARKNA